MNRECKSDAQPFGNNIMDIEQENWDKSYSDFE